jgi:DNA transposition AAA+ family ATPase
MTTTFAEDHLPDGQKPIQTTNVKRSKAFIRLLTDEERKSPTMGVITGLPGIGKTIAAQDYLDSLPPHANTALPIGIKVKVMPRSTPRALAKTIMDSLLEKSRGNNIYEIADEAAAAIERNDLKLVIVDEADRLNEDSFEVLRHLFDKTGCPIVLVGLPSILRVVDRHEKFSSRVGLRMQFLPLELKEVLTVVLPGLVIPRWSYDPEADRLLGEAIWNKVNPSLRKLTNLLYLASQITKAAEAPSITQACIEEAFQWMMTQEDHHRARRKTKQDDGKTKGAQDGKAKGKHEQASEERHDGKQQRQSEQD